MKNISIAIQTTFLILFLSACSTRLDYYNLHPTLTPKRDTKAIKPQHIIGISEVKIANYLQKESFTTRLSPNHLKVKDDTVWASSLAKNIQQVLQANLSALLPSYTVLTYPWEEPFNDKKRLFLTINRFDGDKNGTVVLIGHWSLIDQSRDKLIAGEDFRYIKRGNPNIAGIVETQSQLLGELSHKIAKYIRRR